tara:strand:+ start:185 stop:1213 length:1029 start_codon:yes stop_codon:yes gene_type:complete
MKKILLVTDTWVPQVNGVVTTWVNLKNLFIEKGYSIEVIHPFDYRTLSLPGYKEVKFPIVRAKIIKQKIENIQPDHIHIATEGVLGWIVRSYCLKNNLNFTTSYHTKFPEFLNSLYKIPKSLTYKIIKKFHSKSSMIFINTPTMIRELSQKGFHNLELWNRGIDRNIFKPRVNSKLRNYIDPTQKKKIILYVGRVSKEKNIEKFCDLSQKIDKYRFVIVGDGPIKEKLQKKYSKILFTGYKFGFELAEYYSVADSTVFPSLNDTFGITIIESMACGTPVAAFPVNGPIDIINLGVSGFFHDDIELAIIKSLNCKRELVFESSKKFNWKSSVDIFINAIEKIC